MDVFEFLSDRPADYQAKFLDAVAAHRANEAEREAALIDELLTLGDTPEGEAAESVHQLLRYFIKMAAAMANFDERVTASYANCGPRV